MLVLGLIDTVRLSHIMDSTFGICCNMARVAELTIYQDLPVKCKWPKEQDYISLPAGVLQSEFKLSVPEAERLTFAT